MAPAALMTRMASRGAVAMDRIFPRVAAAILATILAVAVPAPTLAQSPLDAIESAVGGRAGELDRVEQLLSNPDANRRVAAMELLLASGDPAFIRKAAEFGLFSADPQLRRLAVRGILGAGGAFRIETDAAVEGSTDLRDLIAFFGGSLGSDGKASIDFVLKGEFDAARSCWLSPQGKCTLVEAGSSIHLGEWQYTTGAFALDDQGRLAGTLLWRSNGKPIPARIPLID